MTEHGGKYSSYSHKVSQTTNDQISASGMNVLLELINPGPYSLSYTIILTPDDSSIELVGDLGKLLPEWLRQICISHGWVLEFVVVDPKYLQWGVSVPPSLPTGEIIRRTRTSLSKYIHDALHKYPGRKDSADFWAQGYLLLHGLHPQTDMVVERYIQLIRREPATIHSAMR